MSDSVWGDSTLVTGEAVALDMPAASLGLRALSGLLDVLFSVLFTWTMIMVLLIPFAPNLDEATLAAVTVTALVTTFVAVPTFFEARYGRTFGKSIVGLRTVRDDGGPITVRHALTRQLVGFVEVYLLAGSPALVCGLLTARAQRVGDLAAGTYVVRDRVQAPWPQGAAMPPPLAAWARGADIAPLPDPLALAIRELLTRAPQIRPGPRHALAADLARQAVVYTSPGPPLGTPPEVFLQALLVERSRRDAQRLAREESLRRRLLGAPPAAAPSWSRPGPPTRA